VLLPYGMKGGILDLRENAAHGARRRIWDRAFTPAALQSYRPLLDARIEELFAQLGARTGAPLDLMQWLAFLASDFMGDFVYGGMFSATARGHDAAGVHAFGLLASRVVEILGTIPWMRPVAVRLPKTQVQAFLDAALGAVQKRARDGTPFRDLFYYLVRGLRPDSPPNPCLTHCS
jgi:cytochrome P450